MKLSEYVAERIQGLVEEMAEAVITGEVVLEDLTADDAAAVATALMLDVVPVVSGS